MYFGILVSQARQDQERGTTHDAMMLLDAKRLHRFTVLWRSIKGLFA